MDQATRDTIDRKLKQGDKHILWCYAPGYFQGARASAKSMQQLTGLELIADESGKPVAPRIDFRQATASPALQWRSQDHEIVGATSLRCQLFHVRDADAVTLGTLPDRSEVTMAMKRYPEWTSIYSLTAHLPAAVYRELAPSGRRTYLQRAGRYVLCQQDLRDAARKWSRPPHHSLPLGLQRDGRDDPRNRGGQSRHLHARFQERGNADPEMADPIVRLPGTDGAGEYLPSLHDSSESSTICRLSRPATECRLSATRETPR